MNLIYLVLSLPFVFYTLGSTTPEPPPPEPTALITHAPPTGTYTPVFATALVTTNIYASQNFNPSNVMAVLQTGQTVTVVGAYPDYLHWIQVDYNGNLGWMATDYITITGDLATVPTPVLMPTPTMAYFTPTQGALESNFQTATAQALSGEPAPTYTPIPSPTFIPTREVNGRINIIILPQLPHEIIQPDDIEQAMTILEHRLELYGLTDITMDYLQPDAYVNYPRIIISAEDSGFPISAWEFEQLFNVGWIELINFNVVDSLETRRMYLNRCVYTNNTWIMRFDFVNRAIYAEIPVDQFYTYFLLPFQQGICATNPQTNQHFNTLLTLYSINITGTTLDYVEGNWQVVLHLDHRTRIELQNATEGLLNRFIGIAVNGQVRDISIVSHRWDTFRIPARNETDARIISVLAQSPMLPFSFQLGIQEFVDFNRRDAPRPQLEVTETPTPASEQP
jgi:hypothetical protein